MASDYTKQRIAIRYWLLGAGYHRAAEAMDFAESYHTGTRKDGITPEVSHQIEIASLVRTLLPHLAHPEDALCTAFLHDVVEDYGVSIEEIRSRWGDRVAESVDCMSKEVRGVRRKDKDVFSRIANDETASVVKLCDRHQNLSSLVGVFRIEKAREYLAESKILLQGQKISRRLFPRQEPAYELLKLLLETQIELLEIILQVSATAPIGDTEKVPSVQTP